MQVRIVAIGVTALVLGVAGTASAGTTGKASAGKADTSSTATPSSATWNTQSRFTVTNLVSDVKGRAAVTDPGWSTRGDWPWARRSGSPPPAPAWPPSTPVARAR